MLVRMLSLAALVLAPTPLRAIEAWDDIPGSCRLDSWSDVERWRDWNSHSPMAANWAEEKQRFANNPEVWRWHDRLYLSIMDGKVLTLADCSFGDNSHYYEYERFDERGGFHVVHFWQYEAHSYALVMRNTGMIYSLPGRPVTSPKGTRYAYAACFPPDGTTDKGEAEIGILSIVDGRPEVEANAQMPCDVGDCKIEWDGEEAVSAACEDSGSGSVWTTRVLRKDGVWVANP
jgi:hypothetical protein